MVKKMSLMEFDVASVWKVSILSNDRLREKLVVESLV